MLGSVLHLFLFLWKGETRQIGKVETPIKTPEHTAPSGDNGEGLFCGGGSVDMLTGSSQSRQGETLNFHPGALLRPRTI
jgi:hypothetical protein